MHKHHGRRIALAKALHEDAGVAGVDKFAASRCAGDALARLALTCRANSPPAIGQRHPANQQQYQQQPGCEAACTLHSGG